MSDQVQYLTQEGHDEIVRKLQHLQTVRRQEIAERLRQVMTEGGELSENAEYEDAKNDQAFVEGEIIRLQQILSNAVIIEEDEATGIVGLGRRVTLREKGVDDPEVYYLVGPAEANPKTGKISYKSPLGQAMIGKQVGERVKVKAPDGEIVFEILAID